ncbi:MAG: hypothetical protein KVP17_002472 [Porospora cf. gigantea B]|uniref:uncharacterized protein n=1 Tax=Porospora cf. gigantea B TaxID=2853592 RepID=UPI003571C2AD|nr:MAG: hypothetical protein KVP17_002472 [Porospora cf. gigantea B]
MQLFYLKSGGRFLTCDAEANAVSVTDFLPIARSTFKLDVCVPWSPEREQTTLAGFELSGRLTETLEKRQPVTFEEPVFIYGVLPSSVDSASENRLFVSDVQPKPVVRVLVAAATVDGRLRVLFEDLEVLIAAEKEGRLRVDYLFPVIQPDTGPSERGVPIKADRQVLVGFLRHRQMAGYLSASCRVDSSPHIWTLGQANILNNRPAVTNCSTPQPWEGQMCGINLRTPMTPLLSVVLLKGKHCTKDLLLDFTFQELMLVEDLLLVLMGTNGHLIKQQGKRFSVRAPLDMLLAVNELTMADLERKVANSDGFNTPEQALQSHGLQTCGPYVRVQQVSDGLVEMANRVLELAVLHREVVAFIDECRSPMLGPTAQYLAAALDSLVLDFDKRILQLEHETLQETLHRQGTLPLTLQQLFVELQPARRVLEAAATVARACPRLTGRHLLYKLEELRSLSRTEVSDGVLSHILKIASEPQVGIIDRWLSEGVTPVSTEPSILEGYPVSVHQMPRDLAAYTDSIERTGRYLQILKKSRQPHVVDDYPPMVHLLNVTTIQRSLRVAENWASKAIFDFVMKDLRLPRVLEVIWSRMLVLRSDWLTTFIEDVEAGAETEDHMIGLPRVAAFFDVACGVLPEEDSTLFSIALSDVPLEKAGAADSTAVVGQNWQALRTEVTYSHFFDHLTLDYTHHWQLGEVLDLRSRVVYSSAFRLLLAARRAELQLGQAWSVSEHESRHRTFALYSERRDSAWRRDVQDGFCPHSCVLCSPCSTACEKTALWGASNELGAY